MKHKFCRFFPTFICYVVFIASFQVIIFINLLDFYTSNFLGEKMIMEPQMIKMHV